MNVRKQLPILFVDFALGGSPIPAYAWCPSNPQQMEEKIVQLGTEHLEDWPGLAVLRLREPSTDRETYFCGGSAIRPGWILTAAHCLSGIAKTPTGDYEDAQGRRMEVILGVDHLNRVSGKNIFKGDRIVIHDKYWSATRGVMISR